MDSNVALLIGQMEIIAALIVIGFFEQKIKLFSNELIDSFSAIISKLILPLMLLTVIGSISREQLFSSWIFFVSSIVCYLIVIVISKFFGDIFRPKRT